MIDIPKEEFRKFFYVNNGNKELISKSLGISLDQVTKLCNKYYLRSEIKPIDIEILRDMYLVDKKSKNEIAKFFKISRDSLDIRIKYCIDETRDIHNLEKVKDCYENKNYNLTQLLPISNYKAYKDLIIFLNKNNIVNKLKETIKELYIAGLSAKQIADSLNMSEEEIVYNLKHHSIYKYKQLDIDIQILNKERLTYSLSELANKYNCSARTISAYIQKNNLGKKDMKLYFNYDEVYDLYINKNLTLDEVAEQLNCARRTVTLYIKEVNIVKEIRSNSLERKISEYLIENNIDFEVHNRKLIKPYELDFYIPSKNIGIEVCGLYWHSTKINANKYHIFNKFSLAKKNNIRLITIFEDEINSTFNIVKNRLNTILGISKNNKLYARNCIVKEISAREGIDFLNAYHIQGSGKNNYYLGLFNKNTNELLSVMSFSKLNPAKGSKNDIYTVELNRFVNPFNVIGAASKLFKYYINNYNYTKIISYCDLRWGNGNLYSILGFKYISTSKPNYWYIVKNERKHRYTYTKQKLLSILNLENSELTEEELAERLDLYRIYDCGNLKFEWNRV